MYSIRQYYLEDKNIRYHDYSFYETYEQAYNDFTELYKEFKEMGIDDAFVFVPCLPKDKVNSFLEFINKNCSKDLYIIVKI